MTGFIGFALGFVGLVGLIIAGVAVRMRYLPEARLRRKLRQDDPQIIALLPSGEPGRIDGNVLARGQLLESPLGETRCVLYRITLDLGPLGIEPRAAGAQDFPDIVRSVVFAFEDASGTAVVDASEAELHLRTRRLFLARELPAAFVAEHGIPPELLARHGCMFAEQVIVPGQRLAVIGAAVEELDPDGVPEGPDGPMRGTPPVRTRIVAPPGGKLRLVDDDG